MTSLSFDLRKAHLRESQTLFIPKTALNPSYQRAIEEVSRIDQRIDKIATFAIQANSLSLIVIGSLTLFTFTTGSVVFRKSLLAAKVIASTSPILGLSGIAHQIFLKEEIERYARWSLAMSPSRAFFSSVDRNHKIVSFLQDPDLSFVVQADGIRLKSTDQKMSHSMIHSSNDPVAPNHLFIQEMKSKGVYPIPHFLLKRKMQLLVDQLYQNWVQQISFPIVTFEAFFFALIRNEKKLALIDLLGMGPFALLMIACFDKKPLQEIKEDLSFYLSNARNSRHLLHRIVDLEDLEEGILSCLQMAIDSCVNVQIDWKGQVVIKTFSQDTGFSPFVYIFDRKD